jgi:two-component system chemotaxis response regulator CheY
MRQGETILIDDIVDRSDSDSRSTVRKKVKRLSLARLLISNKMSFSSGKNGATPSFEVAPKGQPVQPTREATMATILLVDDDVMCQRLSSFVLQDRHTVITANNGRQALDRLSDTEVDLVITDLSMPVMGGMELLKHIRLQKSCDILPVIVLSGNIHEDNRWHIREAGANALLTKPASPDDLVVLVQQLLVQHGIGR